MQKVLVLGGTRFVGKLLVEKLLLKDYDVTIANRGITVDSFGDTVKRIIVDRCDTNSMQEALGNKEWDIVCDFVCFNAVDALESVEIFKERINHYFNISSQAVYGFYNQPLKESDFDSSTYQFQWKNRFDYDYIEGKKSAEAVFRQKATFPVTSVRFPYILGRDDYSNRLDFYVNHIRNETRINVSNLQAKMSFISSEEASDFLTWLFNNRDIDGPINACSDEALTTQGFLTAIANTMGKEIKLSQNLIAQNKGPYDSEFSWYMCNSYAKNKGFNFNTTNEWLTSLVKSKYVIASNIK
ncbi:NAD-dependent epimerase/dehydratase family protein [Paenibacillus sp. MER TA 81-3]|uniref:NAD-dependent epimerase/dehydratase family protein n=1 Tax=Paenibacillus sp. MER TA 81-3 TaxID=2939573 RepID=UPI00203B9D3F|nr:NAD-dependent epimerase/dehydratase family protein [Paenibacillus sp. MER TA 81-3]MCM3340701.1 NAD-dependent epimerase/dehydratase family protein [Paenibacillus sp. MER TA 81-3]